MTDLDTLRRALRIRQDPGPDGRATPDLGEIMARGRCLRFRRRLAAAGGAVCAAAVVFGTVSGIGHPARPALVPGQRPADSTRTVHPPSPRHAQASAPVPVPSRGSATPTPSDPATPSQGPGTSSPAPTPSTTPSGAAASTPVATTGNGTGPTPVATPSRSQLAMLFRQPSRHLWQTRQQAPAPGCYSTMPLGAGAERGLGATAPLDRGLGATALAPRPGGAPPTSPEVRISGRVVLL
jgi:hypothetical protein